MPGQKSGGDLNINHENRGMKAYPVLEIELELLEGYRDSKTLFSSLASMCFTVFIGLLIPLLTLDISVVSPRLLGYMELACWLSGVVFLLAGIKAWRDSQHLGEITGRIRQKGVEVD